VSDDFDLTEAIDTAAKRLLEAAGFSGKVPADTSKPLPEQVKAFEAVVEWAKTRNVLKPPEKARSKFDGLREQFSSPPPKRGGRRPAAESSPDPVEPAAADTPATGDLFES